MSLVELLSSIADSSHFADIAHTLLFDHLLYVVTPSQETFRYRLLEIEFYLHIPSVHEDPFCHAANQQSLFATWYFHKPPSRSNHLLRGTSPPPVNLFQGFRGGTRKGLDITFGRSPAGIADGPEVRGGILIRSMRRLNDGRVISGPSLLVDEILRVFGAANIQTLVTDVWKKNLNVFESIQPEPSCVKCARMFLRAVCAEDRLVNDSIQIYTSPRVGLDLSNRVTTCSTSDPRVIYIAKPYRFFTHPEQLLVNGRTQTFYGLLSSTRGDTIKTLRSAGFSVKTIEKWKADYQRGKAKASLSQFVGQQGKKLSSSSYLQMLGALTRLKVIGAAINQV